MFSKTNAAYYVFTYLGTFFNQFETYFITWQFFSYYTFAGTWKPTYGYLARSAIPAPQLKKIEIPKVVEMRNASEFHGE